MYYENGHFNVSHLLAKYRQRLGSLRKRRAQTYGIFSIFIVTLLSLYFLNRSQHGLKSREGQVGDRTKTDISDIDLQSELENAWHDDRHIGQGTIDIFLERLHVLEAEYMMVGDDANRNEIRNLKEQLKACRTRDSRQMLDCRNAKEGCSLPEDEWLQLKKLKANKKKYFIAFNLHNNAQLMPHFLTELTKFLSFFEPEQIYVSALESGSSDLAPMLMDLLDHLLDDYHVPHRVLFGDYDMRLMSRHQNRIEFLSNIRNKVLEPLAVLGDKGRWQMHEIKSNKLSNSHPFTHSLKSAFEKGFYSDKSLSYNLSRLARDAEGNPVVFDQVIFINDVFFCVRDILHLVEHEADMACGLDFYPPDKNHPVPCTRENAGYYDIWVGRDILGNRISMCPPYIDQNTLPELVDTLSKGIPVPVQCCWNGMVAMNAEPFHRGLRFRHVKVQRGQRQYYLKSGNARIPSERGEECSASECSILCKDLWNHNYTKIIIDPSVKVSYQEHQEWFYKHRHETWPVIDEATRRQGLMKGISWATNQPEGVECCPMKTNHGYVGDILYGNKGTCYNESTRAGSYKSQSPGLFPNFTST